MLVPKPHDPNTPAITPDELADELAPWEDSPALADDADGARGRQGSPSKVALPDGWLDDPQDDARALAGAESMNSGG